MQCPQPRTNPTVKRELINTLIRSFRRLCDAVLTGEWPEPEIDCRPWS
jgi:hypothetical protein